MLHIDDDKYSFNEKKPAKLLPFYAILIFIAFAGLAGWIWDSGINHQLFQEINKFHFILPNQIWLAINFVTYPRMFIMPAILVAVALVFRRDKLVNALVLVGLYFVIFAGLKHVIAEARPYITLPANSFFWLNQYEDAVKSAHLSFPSGHTGSIAICAFGLNYLLFARCKTLQFIMLLLVVFTGIARICTGWHWPLDVLASGLIAYVLVKTCFTFDIKNLIRNKQHESYRTY